MTTEKPIDDEIDLLELFNTYVKPYRKKYVISALLCAFLFTVVSFMVTPKYQATVELQINSGDGSSQNRLGGLASLAGINTSSAGGTDVLFNMNYLQSREVAEAFIEQEDLRKKLFEKSLNEAGEFESGEGGLLSFLRKDKSDREQIVDEDVYEAPGPTKEITYKRFQRVFNVGVDEKDMTAKVTVLWIDRLQSKRWANDYIAFTNSKLKEKAISESQKKIEYLESQLGQNRAVEVQQSIYSLIESELKEIAVAESTDQYAFKVVQRAFLPERKVSPNRKIYLVLGGFFGIALVFGRVFLAKLKNSNDKLKEK